MFVYVCVAQLWLTVKFRAAFCTSKRRYLFLSGNVGREGSFVDVICRRGPSILGTAGKGSVYSWRLDSVSDGNRYAVGEGRVNSTGL